MKFSVSLFMGLLPLAAFAASPAGMKYDNKTPIEVNADTLDVLQDKNQAIFSGHVVAIQGDIRLKADKMTVTYDKPKEGEEQKAQNQSSGIKKIDAVGGVFLSTPDETASGISGIYDVKNQEIHLKNNVVLTRGKNTLKGESLVYNFATGKSKISGDMTGDKKVRVRALFVPEGKK
jgi:lipopolysaccharide export system protein LptA